jgi:hypothetical protein
MNREEQTTRAPVPDWLRDALNGKAGTKIIPLNKAAGAKRDLSPEEIGRLIVPKARKPNRKTVRAAIRGSVPDAKLRKARIVLADTRKANIGGFTEYGTDRKTVVKVGAPAGDGAFDITVRGHETRHATRHTLSRKKRVTQNEAIASQIVDDVNIESTRLPSISTSGLEQYRRAHLTTAMRDVRSALLDARKMPDTYETRNARLLSAVRSLAMLEHYKGGASYETQMSAVRGRIRLEQLLGERTYNALRAIIRLAKRRNSRERAISMLTLLLEEPPAEDNDGEEIHPAREKENDLLAPVVYGDAVEGKMKVLDLRPKSAYTAKERQVSMRYAPNGVHLNPTRYVSAIVSGDPKGLFSQRVRQKPGGTVVIDASGSMSATAENLTVLARLIPTATIAYYSGYPSGGKGVLAVYADKGKRYAGALPDETLLGGNSVDLAAIRWMMEHPKPWTFVSDRQFCGGTLGSEVLAHALLERAEARGECTVYSSLDAAYEAFGGKIPLEDAAYKLHHGGS